MASPQRSPLPSGRGLLSIGQVLAKLSPEFPDLSPSKLRFWEEQGLISPERTASGYRKFSPNDVQRLRLILVMQRDQYLPLSVIKKHLDAQGDAAVAGLPGSSGIDVSSPLATAHLYTRAEILKATGASANLLQDAVTAGFIPATTAYTTASLEVLGALVELQRSGIEPRHLTALRASAEKEFALIERALTALQKKNDVATRARALHRATELSSHMGVIRSELLRAVISQNLG